MAQEKPAVSDTTTQTKKEKKVRTPWKPQLTGLRVGADITQLIPSFFSDVRQVYELNTELLVDNQFFVTFDFANSVTSRFDDDRTYEYEVSGTYWRTGIDYNVLYAKTRDHAVTMGLKYAQASFSHQLDYTLNDFYYGEFANTIQQDGLVARWLETTFSIKYMILPNLYLASTARIKYKISASSSDGFVVAEAPNYGKLESPTRATINYSILYRIPFPHKKKKIVLPDIK